MSCPVSPEQLWTEPPFILLVWYLPEEMSKFSKNVFTYCSSASLHQQHLKGLKGFGLWPVYPSWPTEAIAVAAAWVLESHRTIQSGRDIWGSLLLFPALSRVNYEVRSASLSFMQSGLEYLQGWRCSCGAQGWILTGFSILTEGWSDPGTPRGKIQLLSAGNVSNFWAKTENSLRLLVLRKSFLIN